MSNANKILDPKRVRELMAQMQPPASAALFSRDNRKSKVENACNMILKTSCSISAAAVSWGVSTKTILQYAKDNNIGIHHKPWDLDDKAKKIVETGSYTQNIPRGLKQRVAYELAMKLGVSEACRRLNVCRRGVYYYCDRYNLPTPERSNRRVR